MSSRQSDIADMKCWLLRLAQRRWRMPAVRVAQLFSEAGVYDCFRYAKSEHIAE